MSEKILRQIRLQKDISIGSLVYLESQNLVYPRDVVGKRSLLGELSDKKSKSLFYILTREVYKNKKLQVQQAELLQVFNKTVFAGKPKKLLLGKTNINSFLLNKYIDHMIAPVDYQDFVHNDFGFPDSDTTPSPTQNKKLTFGHIN